MKGVGKANQGVQAAMKSKAYADVRTQMAAVRQGVLDSQNFWIEHKRDDAVKFNKDALAKIDEFQKVVATDTVDETGAQSALKAVGAACRSCHQVYRATDADDNFILKPGSSTSNELPYGFGRRDVFIDEGDAGRPWRRPWC